MIPKMIKVQKETKDSWIEKGATVTESARAILKKQGYFKVPTTTN